MNQILFFEEKGVGKNMGNTVKFFAISLMAFGAILLGEGGYAIAKNGNFIENKVVTIEEAEDLKPTISYEQNNSKLLVKIDAKKEIGRVICQWNNGDEQELLKVSDQTNIEREIDIPSGTNELKIKVIYKDAPDFPYTQTATITRTSTKIDWAVLPGTSQLQISIEDSKGLESVTHKWNSEEQQSENISEEDNTQLKIVTDIPVGENTIYVEVKNKFGELTKEELKIRGTKKPIIKAMAGKDKVLKIEVTSNDNIKGVDFNLNGNEYLLNITDFIQQGYTIEQLNQSPGLHLEENEYGKITKLTYEYQLQQNVNEITINAETEYAKETISGTLVIPEN